MTTKSNKNNKKQTPKVQKVYNLLKSGKNVSATTLAKSAYGVYNKTTYKNTCRIISAIRAKGFEVNATGNGKFKMN